MNGQNDLAVQAGFAGKWTAAREEVSMADLNISNIYLFDVCFKFVLHGFIPLLRLLFNLAVCCVFNCICLR